MNTTIKGIQDGRRDPNLCLRGVVSVPGDKSISHRAVMLGSIADGITEISHFLSGEDCLATIHCFQKLGVDIQVNGGQVTVSGRGLRGLRAPKDVLNVGNSGTTLRLMTGLLAGQAFNSVITGDASIQRRPMDRVTKPLSMMGACTEGITAPVSIKGTRLTGIRYTLPVASAQVKSALLLASLYAEGETVITERQPTRNHTEIMLNHFGANLQIKDGQIYSRRVEALKAKPVTVPGDISSAAFLLVAASVTPGAELTITGVGINETRAGILTVLREMGADIHVVNEHTCCGEPVADLIVRYAPLTGTTVSGAIIPAIIDEIPILSVAAIYARGRTVIKDAAELKVKESNRIHTVASELSKMGAHVTETADGLIIDGGNGEGSFEGSPLHGAVTDSHLDHRLAMSLAVAALNAKGDTVITDSECVDVSYPGFFAVLGY